VTLNCSSFCCCSACDLCQSACKTVLHIQYCDYWLDKCCLHTVDCSMAASGQFRRGTAVFDT